MSWPEDEDGFGPDDVVQLASVSRETINRLHTVLSCLSEWSARYNLIGPKERRHIWRRHIWDSLQLVPHIPAGARILDIGSGGGFPGLALACWAREAGRGQGAGQVILVETVGKKCAFLRAAAGAADLPVTVIHGRIENQSKLGTVDVVTARAFAPLPRLLSDAEPWLGKGATGLFHKGIRWKEELTDALQAWTFAHEAIPSRSGGDGVILRLSEVCREKPE